MSITLGDKTYLSKHYSVKNLQLVYSIPYPSKENTQATIDHLKKVDQIIFSDLNAGKEIVLTAESPSWEVKIPIRYYEHWWSDSERKLHYECYATDATTFTYKGPIPEHTIPMEYSISHRSGESNSVQEISPDMLTRVINLSVSEGSVPREGDTYKVKITLDGKTDEFELKVNKI